MPILWQGAKLYRAFHPKLLLAGKQSVGGGRLHTQLEEIFRDGGLPTFERVTVLLKVSMYQRHGISSRLY